MNKVRVHMRNIGNFVISLVTIILGLTILWTESEIPNSVSEVTNGELAILKMVLLLFGALFALLGLKWFKLEDVLEIEGTMGE